MPSTGSLQPTSKADTILRNATIAAGALRNISDSSDVPFLQAVSAISLAIFNAVQSVKVNKDECVRMVDQIHELLLAIVQICVNSTTDDVLPPSILNNIGHFARTLQKILSFVEDQLKMGKLKRFFRQGENAQQLEDCKAGLRHALDTFSVQYGVATTAALADLQIKEDARLEELLEMFATRTSFTSSSGDFSSIEGYSTFTTSSLSLSLLPPTPKIFHGRESELKDIVDSFLRESARVAILGPGGIGKTSLATAVIHHTEIAAKYHRYFVPCDSAQTGADVLAAVASHLELESSHNMAQTIVRHLSAGPPTLISLDNLETSWENTSSRSEVEEFLALLTDIPHLALMVTMRGAERPAKVRWTRPFLPPLNPLSYEAARQTFFDITDESSDDADVQELLRLTNHLPLAVSLIANLASFEGSETVLRRWKNESTTLLSEGQDKRSNLDISIMLSLSSPRIQSVPGAHELMQIVSLLPDGVSNSELMQIALPIRDVLKCKAALIRTSVAYLDREERLKILVPIREYVRHTHPPSASLVRPVRTYLYEILMLWKSYRQISAPDCIPRILANMGNFNNVLEWGLKYDDSDISGTIRSILTLEKFSTATSRGTTYLLQQIPHLVERCDDHRLKGEYIATLFESYEYLDIPDPSGLAVKGIQEFKLANDPLGEVQLYNILGSYYLIKHEDVETALAYFRRALSLSVRIGDSNGETKAFMHLAEVEWTKGNNGQSQKYAQLAQQAARLSGHLLAEAHSIKPEITCLTSMGHFKRSIELCIRARELLGLCGMRGGFLDVSLMNLEGDIHFRKSEFLESRSLHVQILEKTGKDQSPIEYAYAQLNIAFVDSAIGADEETVHQSLDVARAMFTSLGSPGGIAYCDLIVSDLQLRQGLKVEPREFYERCISKYRFRDDMAILCLDKLSDLTYGLNNVSDTFAYALVLLGFGKKSPDMVAIHTSFRCLGDIFSAQGDEATAIALFTVALEGFTHMDIHLGRAECMVRLGDFAITHGDIAKAKVLWTDARPLYERSSQAGKISSVDERLNSLQ